MEKPRRAVISGGSWGNLGPTGPFPMSAHSLRNLGITWPGSALAGLLASGGSPSLGGWNSLAPSLQKLFFFSPLLFLPCSRGLLRKHSVARQPSSLLSSWIPGNSVQANSWSALRAGAVHGASSPVWPRVSPSEAPQRLPCTADFLDVDVKASLEIHTRPLPNFSLSLQAVHTQCLT